MYRCTLHERFSLFEDSFVTNILLFQLKLCWHSRFSNLYASVRLQYFFRMNSYSWTCRVKKYMDMLGIIPRSGVLKSKFRNSSGLKKKKRLPEFLSGILVGEERRVVFVLSESPPRGEAVVHTGLWGWLLALLPPFSAPSRANSPPVAGISGQWQRSKDLGSRGWFHILLAKWLRQVT